jgi:hypothetical protein
MLLPPGGSIYFFREKLIVILTLKNPRIAVYCR